MNFLANADAIIFDMRQNGGGHPGLIQYICSYLFDAPTHLNSLYWRQGDRTEEFWTLDDVPGPKMPDVPVFVLTSSYTFSGAEEFSYNLQTRERATLVGETTGGGANPGGRMPVNQRFGIFIPTGRAINPITGTNWEGIGVVPDIAVDADEAYDTALAMAWVLPSNKSAFCFSEWGSRGRNSPPRWTPRAGPCCANAWARSTARWQASAAGGPWALAPTGWAVWRTVYPKRCIPT